MLKLIVDNTQNGRVEITDEINLMPFCEAMYRLTVKNDGDEHIARLAWGKNLYLEESEDGKLVLAEEVLNESMSLTLKMIWIPKPEDMFNDDWYVL